MKLTRQQHDAIVRRMGRQAPRPGVTGAPCVSAGRCVLPWPPTNNNLYTVSRGRKILSDEGRKYRDMAIQKIAAQRTIDMVNGAVSVKIIANPPDRRQRDLDNLLKAPLDCLVKSGVIEDDSKIQSLSIEWGRVAKDGHLVVQVLHAAASKDIEIQEIL